MQRDDITVVHASECKCFSMKPIIAGALVAIGLTFLLHLFSIAIGLTAYTTNSQGIENLTLGGLIGTALGMVVAMFVAGWIAGYLGKRYCVENHLGALYGFLAWCVALLVSIFIFGFIEHYIYFYSHIIAGVPYTTQTMAASTSIAQAAGAGSAETKIVLSAYIVFGLFFLGAFASSLGGHCGMTHHCKKRDEVVVK